MLVPHIFGFAFVTFCMSFATARQSSRVAASGRDSKNFSTLASVTLVFGSRGMEWSSRVDACLGAIDGLPRTAVVRRYYRCIPPPRRGPGICPVRDSVLSFQAP